MQKKIDKIPVLLQIDRKLIVIFFDFFILDMRTCEKKHNKGKTIQKCCTC